MVLRETTFLVGGVLMIGLGVALAAGLFWAGAGLEYLEAWLAAGLAMGFGAFFIRVGREAAEDRRDTLRRLETEGDPSNRGSLP
jgi:hypothetical protein